MTRKEMKMCTFGVVLCLAVLVVAKPVDADLDFVTLNDPSASNAASSVDGTFALGISGAAIVGNYNDASGNLHGFEYVGGTYNTLDFPGSSSTSAQGISGGTILGDYKPTSTSAEQGFIYQDGTYESLSAPSATGRTVAAGIDGNNIVGYYDDAAGTHGFIYDGSTWSTLDDPSAPAGKTFATGISGSNVVGIYIDSVSEHGFLYNTITQRYTTLNDPLAGSSNTQPLGISGNTIVGFYGPDHGRGVGDNGFLYDMVAQAYTTLDDPLETNGSAVGGIDGSTVVGAYQDSNGAHGFEVTVPEPASLSLLVAPGAMSMLRQPRGQKRQKKRGRGPFPTNRAPCRSSTFCAPK